MPFIELDTSLPASKFTQEFMQKLCSAAAATLDKPYSLSLKRMNMVVRPDLPMIVGGASEPSVMLTVSAVAATDTAEKNKEHSAKLFQFLTQELGLSEDCIVIKFCSLEPFQVGKKGTVMTFL